MAGRYRGTQGPAIRTGRGTEVLDVAERDARLAGVGGQLERTEVVDADGAARRLLAVERPRAHHLADRRGHRQPFVANALGQRCVGRPIYRGEPLEERDQQLALTGAVPERPRALDLLRRLEVDPDADDDVPQVAVLDARFQQDPADLRPVEQDVVRPLARDPAAGHVADRVGHARPREQRQEPRAGRRQRRTEHQREQERSVGHVGPGAADAAVAFGLVRSRYQRPLGAVLAGQGNRQRVGRPGNLLRTHGGVDRDRSQGSPQVVVGQHVVTEWHRTLMEGTIRE
jgi:hypothetical protein